MNFFTKDSYGGENDYTVEFQAPADVSEEIIGDVENDLEDEYGHGFVNAGDFPDPNW